MEPGYIVVLYSQGDDEPWVGSVRCRTKEAAGEIMERLMSVDEDSLLKVWIVEDS